MNNIMGTCSICGGLVRWPSLMVDPIPSCERCGAVPKNARGPVIEMDPGSGKVPEGRSERPDLRNPARG